MIHHGLAAWIFGGPNLQPCLRVFSTGLNHELYSVYWNKGGRSVFFRLTAWFLEIVLPGINPTSSIINQVVVHNDF